VSVSRAFSRRADSSLFLAGDTPAATLLVMPYKDLTPPAGDKITRTDKLSVPDKPVIPFIRGDGTGPDIWDGAGPSFMPQLIQSGKVTHTGRPYLGISPTDASSATSQPFGGTGVTSGALVSGLASGGPATSAGVQVGDVITKINGVAVTDAQDLLTVLAADKPGDTVTLGLDRNGSSLSIQVQLGELPA